MLSAPGSFSFVSTSPIGTFVSRDAACIAISATLRALDVSEVAIGKAINSLNAIGGYYCCAVKPSQLLSTTPQSQLSTRGDASTRSTATDSEDELPEPAPSAPPDEIMASESPIQLFDIFDRGHLKDSACQTHETASTNDIGLQAFIPPRHPRRSRCNGKAVQTDVCVPISQDLDVHTSSIVASVAKPTVQNVSEVINCKDDTDEDQKYRGDPSNPIMMGDQDAVDSEVNNKETKNIASAVIMLQEIAACMSKLPTKSDIESITKL